LTKVAETITIEDSEALLCQHTVELKVENSQLKAIATESVETISTLQHTVDARVEDYKLLMDGNKGLLAERDDFRYRCEDLQAKLLRIRSDAKKRSVDLDADEKRLRDFEGGLI
jgi:hypothetical protein